MAKPVIEDSYTSRNLPRAKLKYKFSDIIKDANGLVLMT